MDVGKQHEGRDYRQDQHDSGDTVQDGREDQDRQINKVHDLANAADVDPRSLDGDVLPGLVEYLQQVVRNLEHCLQKKDEQAADADLFTDHVMEQNRMMSLCLAQMQKSMMDYATEIEKECSAYQISCSGSKKSCLELQNLVVTLMEEVKTLNKLSQLRKQAYLQVVSKLCKRSEIFVEILCVVDKIKEGRVKWEKGKRGFRMYFRKTLERFATCRSLGKESLTEEMCGFLDNVMFKAEECMYSDDLHSGLSGRVKNASRYCEEVDRVVWDQVEDRMRCENKEKLAPMVSHFEDRVKSACDMPGLLTALLDLMKLRKSLFDDELANPEGAGYKVTLEDSGEVSYFTEDGCRVAFTVLDEALAECCALASRNVDDTTEMTPNKNEQRVKKVHVHYTSQVGEYGQQITRGSDSPQEQLSADSLEIDEGTVCTGQIHESKDEDASDNEDSGNPQSLIGQVVSQRSFADTSQGMHRVDVVNKSSSRTTLDVESLEIKSDRIENTSSGSQPEGKPPFYTKIQDTDSVQNQNSSEKKETLLLSNEYECDSEQAQQRFSSQAIVTTIKDMFQFGESMSSCKSLPKFTPRTCASSSMSLASNDSLFMSCSTLQQQTGGKFGTSLRKSSLDNGLTVGSICCNKMTNSERGEPQRREISRSKSDDGYLRRSRSRSPIKNASGQDSVSVRNLSTNSVPLRRVVGKMDYLYPIAVSVDSLDSFHGINVNNPRGIAAVSESSVKSKSSETGEITAGSVVNSKDLVSSESVDLKPSADWSEMVREVGSAPVCLSELSFVELKSAKYSSLDGKSVATRSQSATEKMNQTFVVSATDGSIKLPVVHSMDSADSVASCEQMESTVVSDSQETKDRPYSKSVQPQKDDVQYQTLPCLKHQDRVQIVQILPELNKCLISDSCEMVSPSDLSNGCVRTSTPDDKNGTGKVADGEVVSCHAEEGFVGCSASVSFSHCSSDVSSLSGMPARTTQRESLLMTEEKDSKENVLNVHHGSVCSPANSLDVDATDATFTIETTSGEEARKRAKSKKQKPIRNKKETSKEKKRSIRGKDQDPGGVLKCVAIKKKESKTIEALQQKNNSPRTPVYRLREKFNAHLDKHMAPSPSGINTKTLSGGHRSGTESKIPSAPPKPVSTPRNKRRAYRRFLEVKGSAQVLPELSKTPREKMSNSRPPVKNILAERQGYSTESEASSASQGERILQSAPGRDSLLVDVQKAGKDVVEALKEEEVGKSHFADDQIPANQGEISQRKFLFDDEGHMLEVTGGVRTSDKKMDIVHVTETSKLTTKRGDQLESKSQVNENVQINIEEIVKKFGKVTGKDVSILETTDAGDDARKQNRKLRKAVESVGEIAGNSDSSQREKANDKKEEDLSGVQDNTSERGIKAGATNDQGPVDENLQGESRNGEVRSSGRVDELEVPSKKNAGNGQSECRKEEDGPSEDSQIGGLKSLMLTGNPGQEMDCGAESIQAPNCHGRYSLGEDVLSVLPIPTSLALVSSPSKATAYNVLSLSSKSSKYHFPKSSKNKKKELIEVVRCAPKGQICKQTDMAADLKEQGIKGVASGCKQSAEGAMEGLLQMRRQPSQDQNNKLENDDIFRNGAVVQLGNASPTKNPDGNKMKNKDKMSWKGKAGQNTSKHVQTHSKDEGPTGGRTCLPSVSLKGKFESSSIANGGQLNEISRREFEKRQDKGIFVLSELKPVSKIKTTNSFDDIEPKGFEPKTSQGTRFRSNSKGRRSQTSICLKSQLSDVKKMPGHVDAIVASTRTSTNSNLKLPLDKRSSDHGHEEDLTEGGAASIDVPVGLTLPKRIRNKTCPLRKISFPHIPVSKTNSVKTSKPASPRFCNQKSLPRLPNIATPTPCKTGSKKEHRSLHDM